MSNLVSFLIGVAIVLVLIVGTLTIFAIDSTFFR